MNWRALDLELAEHGLFVMGTSRDEAKNIALIGAGPQMWSVFSTSHYISDALPDPLDRWSKDILCPIAARLDAEAVFPSDGPPYPPFIRWAQASGRFWQSPTGMLVHDTAGLMISLRGAICIAEVEPQHQVMGTSPCENCPSQPCRTACPVDALSVSEGYDVSACHRFLNTDAGEDCMAKGCKARRACPISRAFDRDPEQSAFHMRSFHPS